MSACQRRHLDLVLVVDDNDDVRENVVECLEANGFGCWSAASRDEALALLDREGTAPAAVLTDLTMPGMSLDRFLDALALHPTAAGVPVLVMTGACCLDLPAGLAPERVLAKPFTVPRLFEAVAAAIVACRLQPVAA
jgi:CheY-like chemotaxis protein